MTTDVLFKIGGLVLCGGVLVECVGLVLTSRIQLYRAFTIMAVGFLLWCSGIAMMIAARAFEAANP